MQSGNVGNNHCPSITDKLLADIESKQKEMAANIYEIKKDGVIASNERLTAIGASLDTMASFFRKLDNCETSVIFYSSVVDTLEIKLTILKIELAETI